jgi:hypothetical protein
MGSRIRKIESSRLVIAITRYRRARRQFVAALVAECPGRILVDRRQAWYVTPDGRLRQLAAVHLVRAAKVATEASVNGQTS